MSLHTIENDILRLTVDDHGAEIKSLLRLDDDTELMWQADPEYWGRTSPVLFPIVGSYFEKESVYEGKTYEMGQHGFARDMDFKVITESDDTLSFELVSNASTREKYPFDFVLKVSYTLIENQVKVRWQVKNPNTSKMYFSIGGHPAFNCDLNTYSLRFENMLKPVDEIKAGIISADGSGCLSDEVDTYKLEDGVLAMSDELFSKDALIIENQEIDTVTLVDDEDEDVLTIVMDVPLFGIWSPVGKSAPFVCIEPWYGRCDRVGFNKDLTKREFGNELDPGEEFDKSYSIVVAD